MGAKTALIGSTGFVGKNLDTAGQFTDRYHSKNIHEIAGTEYDTIVCAGVSAVKWWANKHPQEDWQGIQKLLDGLAATRAHTFVLISTIDVYPSPDGVDEATLLDDVDNHIYGKHRYKVEGFIKEHFENHYILRLPALFGPGLKKNVLFDLLNDNCLDVINPKSRFQYYDVLRLSQDIQKVMAQQLRLVNLATEPLTTQSITERFFPGKLYGDNPAPQAQYDFWSRHAEVLGGAQHYLYDAKTVMDDLEAFVARETKAS